MNNQLVITGIITHVLPPENGVSKATDKEWKKQTAVLQTQELYPKYIAFDMFNNRIVPLKVGQSVQVQISVESREYQGKWYTNINALAITPAPGAAGGYQAPQPQQAPMAPQPQQAGGTAHYDNQGNELPF